MVHTRLVIVLSSFVVFYFVRLFLMLIFFFFFSSRRRHTRYWRDWSSDVCSSDLAPRDGPPGLDREVAQAHVIVAEAGEIAELAADGLAGQLEDPGVHLAHHADRSEERRVGKECRSRWSAYH